MTEETVFNKEEGGTPTPPVTQENPVTQQQPVIPQELAEWVGPGKKYQSVDEVYKAFPHAQQHISTLEQRMQELEQELQKRKSAEDVLQEIRGNTTNQQKPTSQGVEVNESVLSELVEKKLREHVTVQNQQNNWNKVEETFLSTFADKADEKFISIAKENNLSVAEFKSLAKKSPQLVLNLAGLNKPQQKPIPGAVQGGVNTQATFGTKTNDELSAKVGIGATSRDLARAWQITRQKVHKKFNIEG